MKGLAGAPAVTVFRTEVLLNSKRVAPYVMALLFAGNAWLWWAKGPAAYHGWVANSDFFVVRIFAVFSFMTLPLFTALIMGDPVIRDFRAGVTPLIFSKPVGRAAYLLGKFSGNFFVLVCCQAAFALTLVLLQAFPGSGPALRPARVLVFVEHFFAVVVVSHLLLAAAYFTVGALTRNAKIVYGLAAAFYPLYIFHQAVLLKHLPQRWRIALDPLLMNWPDLTAKAGGARWLDAETVNRLVFSYNNPDVIANRAAMIGAAAACLAFLYARFSTVEQSKKDESGDAFTSISLGTASERLSAGAESFDLNQATQVEEVAPLKLAELPKVSVLTVGALAGLRQLAAATAVELRLLFAERSLFVLLPLAVLASALGLVYYEAAPAPSYSAVYAARAADSFLLFMIAVAVFYTGEAMHRDRELRIEPVLWSVPAPNFVLLLSKFLTTLLLSVAVGALVGAAVLALQIFKGHAPFELLPHLKTQALILFPSAAFAVAAATALNVLLRDKYLAYAACLAAACGLLYLFNLGHNHWLYNPVLYELWSPDDLEGGAARLPLILAHRIYCLALAAFCLSLAHLFHGRKASGVRRGGARWAIFAAMASGAAAVLAGLWIYAHV